MSEEKEYYTWKELRKQINDEISDDCIVQGINIYRDDMGETSFIFFRNKERDRVYIKSVYPNKFIRAIETISFDHFYKEDLGEKPSRPNLKVHIREETATDF